MGFLLRLPAIIFIIVTASIAGFSIAVNNMPSANELYERRIKERLEEAEYIFNWVGAIYFTLPMIAFAMVKDWTRAFFDCFHPFTLWLDALYSAIVVIQLIIFVGEIENNIGRIAIEYGGVAMELSCVFEYIMLKQSNDPDFRLHIPHAQNIFALVFMLVFGFSTLLQLQFKYDVPDGYEKVAWRIAYIGMFLQVLQPLSSMFFRASPGGNFDDDEVATRNIKLGAAIIKMSTSLYDLWLCISKGYWYSPYRKPFAVMTIVSLSVNCSLVLCRYIGPGMIKDGFDGVVAWIMRRSIAIKDCIEEICTWGVLGTWVKAWVELQRAKKAAARHRNAAGFALEENSNTSWLKRIATGIKNLWGVLCAWVMAWVKVQRAKNALAAARRRNAGLSLEEHLGALRV